MVENTQISNFELYKNEHDEIHWFLDKEDDTNITNHPVRSVTKNNTKTIATITSKTEKPHIKKLITSGLRIFMIKGALFKSEEYADIIRRITTELAKLKEIPTFIFDLQGPVPVVTNLYNKEEKKEKINVRPGQLLKITNKNKSLKTEDLIVIDKKIYSSVKKGDSILFDSNLILNVISQEDFFNEQESFHINSEGKEIVIRRDNLRTKSIKISSSDNTPNIDHETLSKNNNTAYNNYNSNNTINRRSRTSSVVIPSISEETANTDAKNKIGSHTNVYNFNSVGNNNNVLINNCSTNNLANNITEKAHNLKYSVVNNISPVKSCNSNNNFYYGVSSLTDNVKSINNTTNNVYNSCNNINANQSKHRNSIQSIDNTHKNNNQSNKPISLLDRREMLKRDRKTNSSSKDKNLQMVSHPTLLIDLNKDDILKTKQNTLNNEYKKIIKSKQFGLSEIKEEDNVLYKLEKSDKNLMSFKSNINYNNNEKDFDDAVYDCNNLNNNIICNNYKDLSSNYFNLNSNFHKSNSISNVKNTYYSLKERQNLINQGYRFTNESFLNMFGILKKSNSPKKVLVCEVETPGEIHLLSEAFVINDDMNNMLGLPTLGPKDITDISRSLKLNISIISTIINKANDIIEIRKIINEEPFNGKESHEENPEYRNYVGNRIKIFAKILTSHAIKNFDEILNEADGIILDPGVLSNNIGYDDLCLIENYITEKCKLTNKPIYIKTNCFNTLHSVNIPSIADISNIDSSINSGIDGFILNEYFPSEAFIKLQKIVMEIETLVDGKSKYEEVSKSVKFNSDDIVKSHNNLKTLTSFYFIETLFDSSVKITYEIPISLIFLYCDCYLTVKRLSRYRPNCRILCPTNIKNEYNFMRVFRGVSGFYTKTNNVTCYNETLFNE